MELRGKLAVITGASRGIGRALSIKLAKSGCSLLLTGLENNELTILLKELQLYHVEVEILCTDISSIEARNELIQWILNKKIPPDILINNAGIGGDFGRFEHLNFAHIKKIIDVNLNALVHITHELLPSLKKNTPTKIVNISSGIARLPYPGLAIYGATKAFITSFSESLACELSGTSIDVLCFHPGFTQTSFIKSSKMNIQKIPKKFIHTPEYTADRIVHAIKKDKLFVYSDFITNWGSKFGMLLQPRLKVNIFKNLFWKLPDENKKKL